MTLIVALRCRDGVLMASDSQGTEDPYGVRFEVQKVFKLTPRAVWASSGLGQVMHDLVVEAGRRASELDAAGDMRDMLVDIVRPILQKHYSAYLPVQGAAGPPFSDTLVCGVTGGGEPWILEIDRQCVCTAYAERGFHAIGSAAAFAQLAVALLAHFDVRNRPLAQAKAIAYRVMDIAIQTSAQGVGPPIQMWVADHDGARRLDDAELEQLRTIVGAWQELERETLNRAFGLHNENAEPRASPSGES